MSVHLIHDLGQEQLIAPFARATAACGRELSEAHEIVRPETEADICPDCLSWSKHNRYQSVRHAVEMSAGENRSAVGPAALTEKPAARRTSRYGKPAERSSAVASNEGGTRSSPSSK